MANGILEAVSAAIGEALNEMGGFRSTRLTASWLKGQTTAFVESTFDWPVPGSFVMNGVLYSYSGKTPTSFTGVTYLEGSSPVNGAQKDHRVESEAIDLSKTFSVIDKTIQNLFVDTATGEALSALGRNLGVDRPPGLEDDDTFRKVIRALAYAPKGTFFAIDLALNAFFGPGNYEIWENFPTYRNTVFIRILGGLYLASGSAGQAYLTRQERRPLNTLTSQLTIEGPLTTVQGVRLADEQATTSFVAQKPSVELESRYVGDAGVPIWTFTGAGGASEGTDVISSAGDGGVTRMQDNLAAHTLTYHHTARIRPESEAYFELHLRPAVIPSAAASAGLQFAMHLRDGARDMAVGFFNGGGTAVNIGFISTGSGALLGGVAAVLDTGRYDGVTIRKRGTDKVQLLVGAAVVQELDILAFDGTALNEFRFGCESNTITGVDVWLKLASFYAHTKTDYWNLRGTAGQTTAPTTFDTNSAAIVTQDVGRAFRTYDAATKKNNGQWYVDTRIDADLVTLAGPWQQLAIVESANPTRVRVAGNLRAFKFPEDVGKKIELDASTTPNPGTYVIDSILDPSTGYASAYAGSSEDYSDTITVSGGPSFVTETEIPWRLVPDFSLQTPIAWELSGAGSVATLTLQLRANPPLNVPGGYVVIVEAFYTQVLSAQLLAGTEIVNEELSPGNFAYYPFYLPSNPLGPLAAFIDELTVAGVIPEVSL